MPKIEIWRKYYLGIVKISAENSLKVRYNKAKNI